MSEQIKTPLDYEIIETLTKELYRWEPNNKELRRFLSMDNFEIAAIRKAIEVIKAEDRQRKS